MSTANFSISTDRGNVTTLYALSSNETGEISLNCYLPQGEWLIDSCNFLLSSISSPAVTVQDYPGVFTQRNRGGVIIDSMDLGYAAVYSADTNWVRFTTKGDMILADGDYFRYSNRDLEAGSTMDVNVYLRATRLR